MKFTQEIHACPICERTVARVVRKTWRDSVDKVLPHHAVTLRLGYSLGGWGSRRDWVYEFASEHVCADCFNAIDKHASAMARALERRKNYPDESEDDAVIRRAGVKP